MVYLDSVDAAGVLGVKTSIAACKILRERGVQAVTAGGSVPNQYDAQAVVQVTFDRQREALQRHRNDPATYAKEIVGQLRPDRREDTVVLADGRKVRREPGMSDREKAELTGTKIDPMVMLSADATMIFGPGVLRAAAADLKPGICGYCVAKIETPWGGIGPDLSDACRVLLGEPCLRCRVDLTPMKAQAARTASASPRMANSVRKALEWRQRATQLRGQGDAAGAAVAERNAGHWLRYGRQNPGE